jgi:hypothetical protein
MVKPELDVSIDYYSLLNITIRADNEEIKKQYRKLGTPLIPIVPCSPSVSLARCSLFFSIFIQLTNKQRYYTTPTAT